MFVNFHSRQAKLYDRKVSVWRALSSFLASLMLLFLSFNTAHAHETRPSIADVIVTRDNVTLDIQVNLEALVAGIDLSAVTDTDEAQEAADYDTLRALPPSEMEEAFRRFWPVLRDGFTIQTGEAAIVPELVDVEITDEPNFELLRDSTIKIRADLPGGDAPVAIGWDKKFGPLVMRQMNGGDEAYTGFLRNGEVSSPLPRVGALDEGSWAVFLRYIVVGFEHIVPLGLDHILFVLGLFFLSPKLKPLLFQVTAFTVAHTVTLALGILGLVTISPAIVEPLIAASIVYIAVENIVAREMSRWRLIIVFLFGLLHGLGFASVLGDFGLDGSRFVTSLIGFNIGVEFGQLTVLALAFFAVGIWFSGKSWYKSYVSNPVSVLIGLIGAYWFVERVFL